MATVFCGGISAGFVELTGKKIRIIKPAGKGDFGDGVFRAAQVFGCPLDAEVLEVGQRGLSGCLAEHPVKCSLGHSAHFCHFLEADPIPIPGFDVPDAFGDAADGVGRDLHFTTRVPAEKDH